MILLVLFCFPSLNFKLSCCSAGLSVCHYCQSIYLYLRLISPNPYLHTLIQKYRTTSLTDSSTPNLSLSTSNSMSEIETLATTPKSPVFPDTLSSVTALARFEFEAGRGNDGTKVMMVEWQDDDQNRHQAGGKWQVSWSGKRTVFSADDAPSDNIRRVYCLLPPGAKVPPHVTLEYHPPPRAASSGGSESESGSKSAPLKMTVNPLPAIFTPELGATAKTSGKKGVLHTIWAKKRLQVLEKEIAHEQKHNPEGVALEMALSERAWIETNFGVLAKPPNLDLSNILPSATTIPPTSPGITSPKSPSGRRLSEKLKGLSIGTSDKDLAAGLNTPTREAHPLSPETSDMAYSSFSAFRGNLNGPKRVVAKEPPEHIKRQQQETNASEATSLDFRAQQPQPQPQPQPQNDTDPPDDNDDLFAVALSPRSPNVPKSPFSVSSAEVGAFAKIKGER
ncbi:hypothetical protein HRR83_009239 [Exophiala dermatitidis]|nr:hypothetical protein HRR73_009394 [Exophiala dermatitidis]KAJ4503013.1 hypothetical protein HRR74_009402 [Exophiala dermatitidis]KAJ4531627.1 hypothetical protein HRR77_009279 [Exophiala dermatitidis]KAJ4548039.1 hypothetical protein HRR76_000657 [Exophiala dermatitidis]KAJ4568202.1 hypothetical protein HRR82_008104 [Exophiala dermatitidis]